MVALRVGEDTVAEYQVTPEIDARYSPRPYLHPVRTLSGVLVTDAFPEDHRWHLGVSLAVQDVSGTNLWGGRTYVRDQGYTWLPDHGRIEHLSWVEQTDTRLVERLAWRDPAGKTLLTEDRTIAVRPLSPAAWVLDFAYELTAPEGRDITLGSPATNGRPGGAGYGGFFWRAAPGSTVEVFTERAAGEEAVNGSTDRWVAMVADAYTLIFQGLAEGDRWFVRSAMYPGVCAAFAFEKPRVIPAGTRRAGRHAVVVADGALSKQEVERLAR
jgi:hypothetical protein